MSIVGGGIGAPAKSRQPTSPRLSHTQPSNPSRHPSVTSPDRPVTIPESAVTIPDRPVTIGRNTHNALLVIDELGFEPMTRQEASLFFRLVTYRYGRGAILITTNKSVREWTELLAGDEVLTTAILDRLLHRAHVLNIKGRSYRLRDLEQALSMQRT